jgi:ADP-ribosyl-[dinitrogen reductase] hydrolase
VARTTRQDRLTGGIWGLLIGDALGVPYEFTPPQRIPLPDKIEFIPPVDFLRAHHGVKPGTWSDDGAQALCLLASLLDLGRMDPQDCMERIFRWFRHGEYAVGKDVFDVGMQTSEALSRFQKGTPALECGRRDEMGNGNGSLMRILPLALWHRGDDRELVHDTMQHSRITHGHLRAGLCCALYCVWARMLLEERLDAWKHAIETLEGIFPEGTPERKELDENIHPRVKQAGKGSGYVLDSLWSVRQCMEAGDYTDVVKAAVSLGHDTDTTACIAGGVAGVRDGVQTIPVRWMKALRGKELVEPLLERLLAWNATPRPNQG